MNKSQKEMIKLLQQLMKNLNISFIENETNIKYEEYYFNGIQIPQDIEIKNIDFNSSKISWKVNKINFKNIDNKNVKYKVEIKKENEEDNYTQVYEGEENNCIINNLIENVYYEVRICSFYDDLNGPWSKNKKFKSMEIDSIILRESQRENEFLQKIYEWSGYKGMELIYRGTRDGTTTKTFHEKCDNQGPTICLYKNEKGHIFGGYADISWSSDGENHSAPKSFIFTLTNIHGTQPTKFPNSDSNFCVYHHINDGPTFGGCEDIDFHNDFTKNSFTTYFPCRYKDVLDKGKSIFTSDFNNNNQNFKVKEIEVFKLFK